MSSSLRVKAARTLVASFSGRWQRKVKRDVRSASTLTAIGGRMAAYTGREIKWQWLMEGSKLDIFPKNPGPGPGLFTPVPIPGKVDLI